MKEYKSSCGCVIHVIKWSAKANSVTVKNCSLHKAAADLLAALQAARDFLMDGTPLDAISDLERHTLEQIEQAIRKATGA